MIQQQRAVALAVNGGIDEQRVDLASVHDEEADRSAGVVERQPQVRAGQETLRHHDVDFGPVGADRAEIDIMVAERFLPGADLWLALDDTGRAVGFLVMDGSQIDALFVDPAVHGQGYGTLLLDHALSLAPDATVDASEQATNAVPFYLSRGFRIVGRSDTDPQGRPYPLVHLAR